MLDSARRKERPVITRRTIAIVGLLTAWALAAAAPAAPQTGTVPPQHRLLVASHGVIVQANLFAFCRTIVNPSGPGMGSCGDGFPTATATRVPVHGAGAVAIFTGVPVYDIWASVATANGPETTALRVSSLDTSGRRFAVTLPAGPALPLLLVSIQYRDVAGTAGTTESGDAHFSVGLTAHRHSKVKPSGATAHARVRCGPERGQRRRCRLSERGKIRKPAESPADCQGGRVLVRVLARGRGLLRATVPTSADCRYRLRDRSFSLPSSVESILVRTRFLGSPTLAGKRAPSIRIHLRLR